MRTVYHMNTLRMAGAEGFLGWEGVVSTHKQSYSLCVTYNRVTMYPGSDSQLLMTVNVL